MKQIILEIPYTQMVELDASQLVEKIRKVIEEQAAVDNSWSGCLDFLSSLYMTRDALLKNLNPQMKTLLENIPIITYPSLEKTAQIVKPLSEKGYYIVLDTDFYLNYWRFIILNMCEEISESKFYQILHILYNTALGTNYQYPSIEEMKAESNEGSKHAFFRATYFILAHEFSHFLLGHLDQGTRFVTRNLGFTSQKVYFADQKSELEADKQAIDLLHEIYKGHEEALLDVLTSCTLLFTFLEAINFIIHCLNEIKSTTFDLYNTGESHLNFIGEIIESYVTFHYNTEESHPKPMYRLKILEEYINSLIPKHIFRTLSKRINVVNRELEEIKQMYTGSNMRTILELDTELIYDLQRVSDRLQLNEKKILWKNL